MSNNVDLTLLRSNWAAQGSGAFNNNATARLTNTAVGATGGLARLAPEPKTRTNSLFGSVLASVGSLIGVAGRSSSMRAVGAGLSSVTGAFFGPQTAFNSIDPGYQDLLTTQIETQKQLTLVSLASNIEKSKHETQMAAVRNIRVG